jgi:predicted nucleic acid-binding protein
MPDKSTLIAVDTNFLLDLAEGNKDCWGAVETIRQRLPNAIIFVLPTVIDELTMAHDQPDSLEEQRQASKALYSLRRDWKFQPVDLVPVGHGIVEQTADKIRSAGLIPEEERNDSFILAEAALAECVMLITHDNHLLNVDPSKLKFLLESCDVCCPLIVSPWKVSSFFQKK